MSCQIPLSKLCLLGFLPVALAYQLGWELLFRYLSKQVWVDGSATTLIAFKLVSEIVLYSAMLGLLWRLAITKYRLAIGSVSVLLIAIVAYTGFYLCKFIGWL
ncbi:hypothetical protein [Neiella marina]|uniref:hypothetical protein n=1 Tax=Neiella marina TaxID=508461 RepID=UPI001302D944|nr:hypothetical protein [Neiella marina]